MKSEEVIEIWAKRKLVESGVEFSETSDVNVREEEISGGGCETCWFEYTDLSIYVDHHMVLRTGNESFSEILEELLEIASE